MKRTHAVIIFSALAAILFLSGIECSRQIASDSLIRIHVLADSNQEQDQQLKLLVKDDIVAYLQPLLMQSSSIEESRRIIQTHMPQLEKTARQTLLNNGCNDKITLQYGHFDFPVKYYGSFSLPAGNYEALRILIGEGQGRNWWCVLFPPLCFSDSNVSASGKYTSQMPDTELVIKFKSIEWLEHLKENKKDATEYTGASTSKSI